MIKSSTEGAEYSEMPRRPPRRRFAICALALAFAPATASCTPEQIAALKEHAALKPKCGATEAPPTTYEHIVVVMEENRTWETVGGIGFADPTMPYLHDLATKCTAFADWTETNTDQNSLNQYMGLMSGVSNASTVNDCPPGPTCRSTDNNIFRQVRTAGGTARSFVEGATSGCSGGEVGGNAAKHVPAMYFYGTYSDDSGSHNDHDFCDSEVRPLSEFDVENLPTFAMITPDLCNDGHDCPNATVDEWARAHVQPILNSLTYAAGKTAVVVVYDEDHPVPNLIIAPTARAGIDSATTGAGHAALLKTWEEMLGLPTMPTRDVAAAVSLRGPAHI